MTVQAQIDRYIAEQPEPKRQAILDLHRLIVGISPGCRLWFLDGRNAEGKVVSNPSIGYGSTTLSSAGGEMRAFYRIGVSANTTGLSIYVMGLADKGYLAETYGGRLGKAKISGYCVKFRQLGDLDLGVLEEMIASCMGEAFAGGLALAR